MGVRYNYKVRAAAGLASVLMVACMAAAADNQQVASFEIEKFCSATGFKEACIKSVGGANSTKPKDLIKAAFESTVTEIQSAIKKTAVYKDTASDRWTHGALEVCEDVLGKSIGEIRRSLENLDNFEIGKVDHALGEARIWLSGAGTCRTTCLDAFAKTKGKTKDEVAKILVPAGQLLDNALAMVIEFEKIVKSVDFGAIVKQRQLLRIDEEEEEEASRVRSRKLLGGAGTLSAPPKVTVAQDGSGQVKTITEAVKMVPPGNMEPFVIFVKAGVYEEYVVIPDGTNHVVLVGEGPLKTRISGSRCYPCGYATFQSGTLTVDGRSFSAKDIGIENTRGPDGEQAVALRISGDLGVFHNVHIDGYQDTLYPHLNRQFFRDCRISGTIDFIFGNAIVVFQKCDLVVRKPNPNQACMVTAQGREDSNKTGVTVIQGCTITAEKDFLDAKPPFEAYLGRPWKALSRTVVMQSLIEGFISPLGWAPWSGSWYLDSLRYYEYNNFGAGSDNPGRPPGRVTWEGIKQSKFKDEHEALGFTAAALFLKDEWVVETGVPYAPAFLSDADLPKSADPNVVPKPADPIPNPLPNPTNKKQHMTSHKKKKKSSSS